MGQQQLSVLFLMSIENDSVETQQRLAERRANGETSLGIQGRR